MEQNSIIKGSTEIAMFRQLQKSPSLYKHAIRNSVLKNALQKTRQKIKQLRLVINKLKSELQEVTTLDENKNEIYLLKHHRLLSLRKHEQQLMRYIRTLLRKKSLITKKILEKERLR